MLKIGRVSPLHRDAIMRGEWDEASPEIQSAARHRIAEQERCAAIAEHDYRAPLVKEIGYVPRELEHGRKIAATIRGTS